MSESKAVVPFADFATEHNIALNTWSALVNSLYVGAAPQSVLMAYDYCKARGLDPLRKPVHIVPMRCKVAGTKDKYEWRDVIFPGIQEMRTTASRTGLMAGQDEVVFGPDMEVPVTNDKSVENPTLVTVPQWAKVTVYRLDKTGTPRAYTHIEFFLETVARTGDGRINSMWYKRPHGQLAKCAEAGALRKAFPEELGGEYSAEEMAGKVIGSGGGEVEEAEFTEAPSVAVEQPVEKAVDKPVEKAPVDDRKLKTKPPQAPEKPQPAAPAPETKQEAKPVDGAAPKIDLPAPARRVLASIMKQFNVTDEMLLEHFKKDICLTNINDAINFVKGKNGE